MEIQSFARLFRKNLDRFPGSEQILIALCITFITGLFFVTSYKYEVNFLIGSGLTMPTANALAQVDISTYSSFLQGIIFISIVFAIFMSIVLFSKKIKAFVKHRLFFFFYTLAILILFALKYLLLPHVGIQPTDFLNIALSFIINIASIPTTLYVVYINNRSNPFKEFFKNSSNKISTLLIIIFAFYWFTYGIFTTAGLIAQIQSSPAASSLYVTVNNDSYKLIRKYENTSILKKDDRIYTFGSSDSTPVLYEQR